MTYARFIEESLPNQAHADRIIELYENPQRFKALLRNNRDALMLSTYRKPLKAVEPIIAGHYPEAARLSAEGEAIIDWAAGVSPTWPFKTNLLYSRLQCPPRSTHFHDRTTHLGAEPVYRQPWYEIKERSHRVRRKRFPRCTFLGR